MQKKELKNIIEELDVDLKSSVTKQWCIGYD